MPMVIEMAGSSTVISGSGRGSSGSARVSPIMMSGMPATAMMSPGPAVSAGTRSSASVDQQLGDLDPLDRAVAAAPGDLLALADSVPGVHPAQRDPAQVGDASRFVTWACSGAAGS